MKRSKVGTRSEHLKMIKKLEYHLKSTFNRSVADRERKITLAREAYKPLLDFYSSLYGKKGLSLKKYATEVSREMDRHTYEAHPLRQGGSGFPSLFPLLSPHDATKDIPVKWQGK